jgi:hypothetical protein
MHIKHTLENHRKIVEVELAADTNSYTYEKDTGMIDNEL